MRWMAWAVVGWVVAAPAAQASEFTCVSGNRIEKSGSTVGSWDDQGSDWRIEKGSSTVGFAKKSGSDWRIETSGAKTLGFLKSGKITSAGGSTIGDIGDAKSLASGCPDEIAAALLLLRKEGKF